MKNNSVVQDKMLAKFWLRVNKAGANGCWVWTGTLNAKGYGTFVYKDKRYFAHRVSFGRPVPPGKEIDHVCANKACVNPSHLEAVTHVENMRRFSLRFTHCPQGHAYTPDNLVPHPKSSKICRKCKRSHDSRRHRRNTNMRHERDDVQKKLQELEGKYAALVADRERVRLEAKVDVVKELRSRLCEGDVIGEHELDELLTEYAAALRQVERRDGE